MNRRLFLSGAAVTSALLSLELQAAVIEDPTDADIGFCRDMSVHHVRTGGPVQAAAAEVLENQAMEVGLMRAWLADWGASTAPPTKVMGWMGANFGRL